MFLDIEHLIWISLQIFSKLTIVQACSLENWGCHHTRSFAAGLCSYRPSAWCIWVWSR